MRFAYADPPYIGQAKRHYSHDPKCAEVDHSALIGQLQAEYDGWALSCKSDAKELAWLISLCDQPVRLGAWVKPFCSFKPNVNPAYAWEPVIWYSPVRHSRSDSTVRDWVSANITLRKGLAGAKPRDFALWIFELLGMKANDEFVDLFPGTGGVGKCWDQYGKCFPSQPSLISLAKDSAP